MFQDLSALIPPNGGPVDWAGLARAGLADVFAQMANTSQDPAYHGEGDVLTHTKMVCEALVRQPEYLSGNQKDKTVLFLAALLHDIGKTACTVVEEGAIKSPRHAPIGAVMARELLWKTFGLCGSDESQQLREAVCHLIRYHSFPPYAIGNAEPAYSVLKIASTGELAKDFSLEKLCVLERADVLGRICAERDEVLERVACCRLLAEEEGCLTHPYPFASSYSKRAYFKGKTVWKEQKLYSDTWGEVILLSGLPGTGKDTWIRENHPTLPTVSLDGIRRELKILPTDNQSRVIATAREQAKAYLRKKQPFVWNATSLTPQLREQPIALFEEYGASVKTVFLETGWDEGLRRNKSREAQVPLPVIERMLARLIPPVSHESETVLWQTV